MTNAPLERGPVDRARAAPPALAAALVLAIGCAAFDYTVDDAYVLARYARRLARGLGWTMIDGPPTDGVTGPLAIVPGVVAELVGLDPLIASKIVGLACGALAAALACRAASRHALGGPSAWLVALIAGSGATLGIWSVAGLETGMAALAATIACLAAIARPAPRGAILGVAIAALAWLRPETAVLSTALIATCAARDRREAKIALSIAALGALSLVAFRVALFGSAIPLAWDAKPGELSRGIGYVARGLVIVTGLGGGALLAFRAARRARTLRFLALALSAHVIAVAIAGGDWMPGFRLFAPIVPAYALLAGIGGARAIALTRGLRRRIAIVAVVLAIVAPAVDALVQIPRAREIGETRARIGAPLAHELAALAGDAPVALVDVGYLPWAGGFDVVDLGGITDPTIGRRPGAHLDKQVEPELLAARGASVIVLRSFVAPRIDRDASVTGLAGEPVERRLAASAWLRENFRVDRVIPWNGSYFYVVLVRR
ncbi:hypothetical protein [Sandaracinus amylolyticus]|uniref:hypothetical protein n=1 Tax=Sandaracinus amylolyticus TaxID=927083 RepID=UPI001F46C3BC|nr:hypothetical protein [Sandaracinus amylolyticus]UJR81021.1 Hypothetical protein I5071_30720 [Sandaracinus amylolyticus]